MNKDVVLMVACAIPGMEERSKPYKYGINSWKYWCDKNDCEFFVLDEPLFDNNDMKINYHRYYCYELLEANNIEYNQILITDADSIIHPSCPNFFNLTNNKYTVTQCDGNFDWICRSLENYAHEFEEFNNFNLWGYFNAGFQIFNKSHKPIINEFLEFYWGNKDKIIWMQQNYGVGTDQPIINHIIHKSNVELKYLPYRYCMADLHLKGLLTEDLKYVDIEGIYQFNAIPNNDNSYWTNFFMEKTYKHLYE
jgi:hypothetical protein